MALIVAIEPDRRQGDVLAGLARGPLSAELIVADSAKAALKVIAERTPDLILTSLLMSAKDDAALTERLRELDAAGHRVQTLVIPVFASKPKPRRIRNKRGLLTRLRGASEETTAPDGCDPAVFAAQVHEYLEGIHSDRRAAAVALEDDHLARTPPTPAPPEAAREIDAAALGFEVDSEWYASASAYEPFAPAASDPEPEAPAISEDPAPDVDADVAPETSPAAEPSYAFAEIDLAPAATQPQEAIEPQAETWSEPAEAPMELTAEPSSTEAASDVTAADLTAFVEHLEQEIAQDAASAATAPETVPGTPLADLTSVDDLMAFDVSNVVDFDLNEWLEEAAGETEAPAPVSMLDAATLEQEAAIPAHEDVVVEPESVDAPVLDDAMFADVGPHPDAALEEFLAAFQAPELDEIEVEGEVNGEVEVEQEVVTTRAEVLFEEAEPSEPARDAAETEAVEAPLQTAPAVAEIQPESQPAAPTTTERPEWLELLGAIRRDIEQLRADLPVPNAASQASPTPPHKSKKKQRNKKKKEAAAAQIHEEWGFFNPDQCGFSALVEKLEEITGP